ncbi:MAG: heat-inducible transcriptional repressor HrcA [Clostridiaceae bacterium]|nr:heat-inducible transcriptional repressor HrcA [Clostridiaceae bacterium]
MELPLRQRRILKAIIEHYISTAEPVGSKMLADSFDQPISSATIRNEMSELEELGYLEKPHVSAGRIPSYAAYRLYVNELMDRHRVVSSELDDIRRQMQSKMRELDDIMVSASRVISEMTRRTSVSAVCRGESGRVRKCELITVDGGETYAVVLVTPSAVKTKIIRPALPVEPSTAAMLATAINLSIAEERTANLLPAMLQSAGPHSPLYSLAVQVVEFIQHTEEECGKISDVYVGGAARLLDNVEYQDAQRIRELLESLADRRRLRELMDDAPPGRVQIRIGPEMAEPRLRDASLVFTSYDIDRNTMGIIGIVAPTRMDYADVCAKLTAFVRAVGGMREKPKQIENTGEKHDGTE